LFGDPLGDGDHRPYRARTEKFKRITWTAKGSRPYQAKVLWLQAEKAEGVGGKEEAAEGHGGGGPGGGEGPAEEGEEEAGGGGKSKKIVAKRPSKVLPDGADSCPSEKKRPGDAGEIALQHHHGGGLLGGVGPAAEGDSQIGRGQGRSIVCPIARHRDESLGRFTEFANPIGFALGLHASLDLGNAEFLGHGSSGFGAIAGQQFNVDS